jgi:uncharacterized protein YjbJ (UPF0337 family)
MNEHEIKGKGKQAGGKAEELAGKVTGNEETEARGRGRQAEGKVQETAGSVMDKVRDFARKITGG